MAANLLFSGGAVSTATALQRTSARVDPEHLIAALGRVVPAAEIWLNLPLLEAIAALKAKHDAVIVAHNYQEPLIAAGVADFVGDSLAMARYAAQCTARVIVVCGVHFMAETVKLLCPNKRVLLPNLCARCSLADSVDRDYVRALRRSYPGLPMVAYVNTPAAVKAEADICCTSANAVAVARSLGVQRLIMVPDRHLAGYVARETGLDIVSCHGQCEVHVKYSGVDIDAYRREFPIVVLAHPECTESVQDCADFVGSTSAMSGYLSQTRPRRVLLLTECSMADNLSLQHPDIDFLRPCNLCSYMKSITLFGIATVLEDLSNEIDVDDAVAVAARRSVERMLSL
jgi:quinolinate synthase